MLSSLRFMALVLAAALFAAGCQFQIGPAPEPDPPKNPAAAGAKASVTMPPPVPTPSFEEVGTVARDEAVLLGSLRVDASNTEGIVGAWGSMNYAIPGPGEASIYSLVGVKLGRRGEMLPEQRWSVRCTVGQTCPYALRIPEGDYVVAMLRISKYDEDAALLTMGSIATRLRYLFTADGGKVHYLGRLTFEPPREGRSGKPILKVELTDARDDDLSAMAVPEDTHVHERLPTLEHTGIPKLDYTPFR